MHSTLPFLLIFSLVAPDALAQGKPTLRTPDRIRLAEAFRLGEEMGEKVWKGWNQIPFAVLLITPDFEFLVRHPKHSKDFTSLGYDSLLESEVFSRKRVFQLNFLASFPAVGGIPTIVVGTPENTSKTSTAWVVTLLHEHFHQLQMSESSYQADVSGLNLARGDETGMWMLNSPFPYDSSDVKERFAELAKSLSNALRSVRTNEFPEKLTSYLEARRRFQATLSPDDYKYFSFQLWQEGIARYTEYKMARLASSRFKPSGEFASLPDFKIFGDVADSLFENVVSGLKNLGLSTQRRVVFYSIGAAEGLLLDNANADWQNRYFAEKFYMERYFTQ